MATHRFSGTTDTLSLYGKKQGFVTLSLTSGLTVERVPIAGSPEDEGATYGTIAPTGTLTVTKSQGIALRALLVANSGNGTVCGGIIPSMLLIHGGTLGMPISQTEVTDVRLLFKEDSSDKGTANTESWDISATSMLIDGNKLL